MDEALIDQPNESSTSIVDARAPILKALKNVPWLAVLGRKALEHVSNEARLARFSKGATILAELEVGADLFIIVSGSARVDVMAATGQKKEIARLGPGDACGEISAITRALRSATVTALTEVEALKIERPDFAHLVACYPSIAVHFARLLSARLYEADLALDETVGLLKSGGNADAKIGSIDVRPGQRQLQAKPTIRRAWRELIAGRRRELPFLALISFLAVLFLLRVTINLLSIGGGSLFGVLRFAYTSGITMVFVSTAVGLTRFRRQVQRILAVIFGAGFALILNELSVFLAFDTFYLNMTTRDPTMVFNVEALYRRSESSWAIALMVALLAMLTYLRHFLRRSFFVVLNRIGRTRSRQLADRPADKND